MRGLISEGHQCSTPRPVRAQGVPPRAHAQCLADRSALVASSRQATPAAHLANHWPLLCQHEVHSAALGQVFQRAADLAIANIKTHSPIQLQEGIEVSLPDALEGQGRLLRVPKGDVRALRHRLRRRL